MESKIETPTFGYTFCMLFTEDADSVLIARKIAPTQGIMKLTE